MSFNLLGIPFESRKTYNKTIKLNREANVQYPHIAFFYPFEGTQLREISIEKGLFNPENKIVYQRDRPALNFNNLSEGELIAMLNVFVLYVKLPKYYWPFIRRSEKQDGLGLKLRRKVLEVYEKSVWDNNGWYHDDDFRDNYLKELED